MEIQSPQMVKMRSLRWALLQYDWYCYERGNLDPDVHTVGRPRADWHWAATGKYREVRERPRDPSQCLQREHGPPNMLILDVQFPEL